MTQYTRILEILEETRPRLVVTPVEHMEQENRQAALEQGCNRKLLLLCGEEPLYTRAYGQGPRTAQEVRDMSLDEYKVWRETLPAIIEGKEWRLSPGRHTWQMYKT